MKPLNEATMSELVDELGRCTTKQSNLYAVYRKAADMDPEMVEHKEREQAVRSVIASRVGL